MLALASTAAATPRNRNPTLVDVRFVATIESTEEAVRSDVDAMSTAIRQRVSYSLARSS